MTFFSIVVTLIAFIFVVSTYLINRRVGSLLMLYNVMNLVFVGLGTMLWPFWADIAAIAFSNFNLAAVSYDAYVRASLIFLVGTAIVNIMYTLLYGLIHQNIPKKAYSCDISQSRENANSVSAKKAINFLMPLFLVLGILHIGNQISLAFELNSAKDAYSVFLAGRESVGANYFYHIFVQTILPAGFLTFLIVHDADKRFWMRIYMYTQGCIVVVSLILIFRKGPLLLLFVQLFILFILKSYSYDKTRLLSGLVSKGPIFVVVCLGILSALYVFSGFSHDDPLEYLFVSVSRIVGRLSLPALFYAEYFPKVDDFYGLENVRLFSKIFGFDLISDTALVGTYFERHTLFDISSVASSALYDFYGINGWYSVILGSLFLGTIIYVFDLLTQNLRIAKNATLFIFLTGIIYYFTQASLFRSFAGYGGVFYLALWFVVFKFRWVRAK